MEKETDFDSVVFLGDSVSPGPQPNETIELMSNLNGIFIKGNHEHVMLNPSLTEHWPGGFKALMDWVVDEFDSSGLEFLQTFSEPGLYCVAEQEWLLLHGDEGTSVRHVLPGMPDANFKEIRSDRSESLPVLFGHSHVQFRHRVRDQEFINPGSIGQNRCGRVVACYGLLIDGVFTHHHIEYDIQPWVTAVDRIKPLNHYKTFRDSFIQQTVSGYSAGAVEPWLDLNSRVYL